MKKIISALLVVCLVLGINTSSASAQVKKVLKYDIVLQLHLHQGLVIHIH